MDEELCCPECRSADVRYSQARREWVCLECLHSWSLSPGDGGARSVFISYARDDDRTLARRLHDDLEEEGFEVWLDLVDMPDGPAGNQND